MKQLFDENAVKDGDRGDLPSRNEVAQAVGSSTQVRDLTDRTDGNPRRRPAFGRSKLGVDCSKLHEMGFYCHWINNYPGRVNDALESGYEFVTTDEVEVAPTIGFATADAGNKVSRRVGQTEAGGELLAYLMKIKKAWKEENDAYYQQRVDAIERRIRSGKPTQVGEQDPAQRFYGGASYTRSR
jgi:hypothetical protein